MPISKEELKEQIKKELFKQLLEQKMVDEGVTDFLKSMGQKALSGIGSVAKKGADALEKVDVDEKKLNKIADFLQMAQRDAELSKLILTTKLGKAILGGEEQNKSLQEILTGDFAQMMKAKKITNSDIDDFIKAMSANPKANKMLSGLLGKELPKPEQPVSSTTQQQDQTQQTQPQLFSVEKGKDSLQQRLLKKYGSQLGAEANKFIAAIARDIKSDLAASGIKVQESVEQISSFILKEFLYNSSTLLEQTDEERYRDMVRPAEKANPVDIQGVKEKGQKAVSDIESKGKQNVGSIQAKIKDINSQIAAMQKQIDTSTPQQRKYQEVEIQKLEAQKQNLLSQAKGIKKDTKTQIKSQQAQTNKQVGDYDKHTSLMRKKIARDDAAQKMQNMQKGRENDIAKAEIVKKALNTKRVSKPNFVDVNQAVFSKLNALKKLNPNLAKKVDGLTPQIISAVSKYVEYVVNTSGKKGEVKIAAKTQAKPQPKPAQPATPPAQQQLKEILVQEIFNALTGKDK